MPTIESVMTACPWTIHVTDRLAHARDVMERNAIRHLPVTDEGKLVGVVSQREVILLLSTASKEAPGLSVREAMVADPYVVAAEEPLSRVLATMARRHLGSALVVRDGHLVGIFTAVDACRSFAEHLEGLDDAP